MTLTPQWLDELRARTTLSTLIGRTLKLQKAGREYRACCPFHNEKSPSFYVNDDKGFYHCFGCSAHGDAIRWMTDQRGLPFMDAVKELAQTAGMEVPQPDRRSAERAERAAGLHGVMADAVAWFQEQLGGLSGAEARAYLDRRGVSPATRAAFGLGFAPDSRGKLKTALAKAGNDALVEAGLLISVEDKDPYDRFRGRLMIPIRDARGRTIAFGGRIIDQGEPKYLNSPDTPLFDKGRTLFNLDRASAAARKSGRVIVVEGYLDVIALHQAGIEEAVAPLGTALTEAQLERLWRMADVPILCFDGDSAGQKAAIRAAQRALPMLAPGRSLAFAALPSGQDPDDLVRAGGRDAFEAVLAAAEPLVERLWQHEQASSDLSTPEARAGLRKRLSELASAISDPHVRDQYAHEFRTRFDTAYRSRPAQPPRSSAPWRPGTPPPRPSSAQARSIGSGGVDPMLARAVLCGLIRHPSLIASHAEALAGLILAEREQSSLRDTLIRIALAQPQLESADLAHILTEAGHGRAAERLSRSNGLAFSFLRSNAESSRARRDLAAVIEALAARPEIEAALAAATARLSADWSDAGYAEQQRLQAARDAADRALAELVAGESDAAA